MGVFDRFERRLERLVEGAFAKVFKDEAQPVDIARALQRETDDRRVIVGPGHVIAPSSFVVDLGEHDHARLAPYAEALCAALAEMVTDHAREHGYTFPGPVQVQLAYDPELDTGRFEVHSESAAERAVSGGRVRRAAPSRPPAPAPRRPAPAPTTGGDQDTTEAMQPRHRLVITSNGSTPAGSAGAGRERSVPLTAPVTVIGRSATADLRLDDPGVSRRHAEVQLQGDVVRVVDVGSTNGTSVNGEQVGAKQLASGDRIQVGSTVLVYRSAD